MSSTVMFIHGMFLNPKSWEPWESYFQAEGFQTVAPAWPYHDGEPADLRNNVPEGLGELSLEDIYESISRTARRYDDLILIGHSVGGLIVQKLIADGVGRMGVPICSVAPNKMLSFDWSFFKNSAAITNPLKGNQPFPMDADAFYQTFGNTLPRQASDAAFEKYAMHDSRNVLRDCMGKGGEIDLDYPHAPLLFIAADKDEIIPPELNKKNAESYSDEDSVTDCQVFTNRGHFITGQPDWNEVATYIRKWIALQNSAAPELRVPKGEARPPSRL